METELKLNNSELKIMGILWDMGELPAKEVSLEAAARYGWNKNTTYTILKNLMEKQYVSRREPNFICTPLLDQADVRRCKTRGLINQLFGGSPSKFISSFFENEDLSDDQIAEIKRIIDKGPGN